MFKKHQRPPSDSKVRRRVSSLQDSQLVSFAETSLYDIGKALIEYEKTHAVEWLVEAVSGVEALEALVLEIQKRHDGNS